MIKVALLLLTSVVVAGTLLPARLLNAADADQAVRSLQGINGLQVAVEDLQPNLQKYTKKQDISRERIQASVENQLQAAGIKVLGKDEWLQKPGRPVLYVNVNTHEFQKYQFAYDVRIELRQVVSLDANPTVKTLAATWSTSMTGVVNTGTTDRINDYVKQLVQIFISAYSSANQREVR